MICLRTSLAAAALAITSAIPAGAEIVPSRCRTLSDEGPTTTVKRIRCEFMQRGGNVLVTSAAQEFNVPAAEQSKAYIRINSIPLRFTLTGQNTLEVTQSP